MIALLFLFATFVGQPIPFNHSKHRIPCSGCHQQAPSGEVMSIPTGKECMACHTQVAKDTARYQRPQILRR